MSNVRAAALMVIFVLEGGPEGPPLQVEWPPAFEVATVKPSTSDSAPFSLQRQPGGRLVASNASLAFLIQWAYSLEDGRLFGAPNGADTTRFDIVAQAPDPNPGAGQLPLMMQRLLAERFGLAVHREQRAVTAYALAVDDGGPKFALSKPTGPPGANPFRMSAGGELTGTGVTADMLATALSSQLRQPVQNVTGLDGIFDFTLSWRPDGAFATDDPSRPALFTAVREQLGLRLMSRQALTVVVVVDRVNLTPTEN